MMVGETHAADFVVVCPCARADASCRRTGDRFNEFSFQSVKHIQINNEFNFIQDVSLFSRRRQHKERYV